MKDVRDGNEVERARRRTPASITRRRRHSTSEDSKPLTNRKGTLGDKHREDLIRDVAAMANAEGGLIIYGIAQRKGGYPDQVDDGIDPKVVDADTMN
jgi:hypothetical protein